MKMHIAPIIQNAIDLGSAMNMSFDFSYLNPKLSGKGSSLVAGDYSYDLSQRLFLLALDGMD